ncbi:MAG: hypothetical protein HZA36_00170 [Parcubacteria group bacterium]|nr:hypothetical protein [Parcubacteria group bacterium]
MKRIHERLDATMVLAKKVRRFEKRFDIQGVGALSKTVLEQDQRSLFFVWMQKRGTLALYRPIDYFLGFPLHTLEQEFSLWWVGPLSHNTMSSYSRREDIYSGIDSVITKDFVKASIAKQVSWIFHEDIHALFDDFPWELDESMTTALGELFAMTFFENNSHLKGARRALFELRKMIAHGCIISQELLGFTREVSHFFRTLPRGRMPGKRHYRVIQRMLKRYPVYASSFGEWENTEFEARVSHDLAYYGFYDRIVGLYEKKKDLNWLLKRLRRAPREIRKFEKYLMSLKHSR